MSNNNGQEPVTKEPVLAVILLSKLVKLVLSSYVTAPLHFHINYV